MKYPRFKEWVENFKDTITAREFGNAAAILFEYTGLTPDEFLGLDANEARNKAWTVVSRLVGVLDRDRAVYVKAASKSFYNEMNRSNSFKWDFEEHIIK